jgi:hypothetical protein
MAALSRAQLIVRMALEGDRVAQQARGQRQDRRIAAFASTAEY